MLYKYRPGDIRHCYSDSSKIRNEIGFSSSIKFEDGIIDLVNWVKEQNPEDLSQLASMELTLKGLV